MILTPIRFKPLEDNFIITNDAGSYAIVNNAVFSKIIAGNIDNDVCKALRDKDFFLDNASGQHFRERFDGLMNKYPFGPSRLVLKFTNACNYNCVYCQAGSCAENAEQMCTKETAHNAIDFLLQSKSPHLVFEVQGGEPLMNWEVVKDAVIYARRKSDGRDLGICIMSNLSLLDENKMKFFDRHYVSVGTSIDGAKELMDVQRPKCDGGSSYDATQRGRDIHEKITGRRPGFLTTVTRDGLSRCEETVDMSLDCDGIYNCRSLFYLGRCLDSWDSIGYSVEEYLEYYERALKHCMDRQLKEGKHYVELRTQVYLKKILQGCTGDIEVSSPCGGVVCMVSVDWNGDILACEGSKMLQPPYRDKFVLGNVNDPSCTYHNIYLSNTAMRVCNTMVSQNNPKCSRCPYLPYCGRCAVEQSMSDAYSMRECQINEGQLDIIFKYLQDPTYSKILQSWVEEKRRRPR